MYKKGIMFDLEAEIIPGQSAAGIFLGDKIKDILKQIEPLDIVNLHGGSCYKFGPVAVWTGHSDRIIRQIGLYNGYRGRISNRISVGSTIGDIQESLGRVFEDEVDNLVVEGFPGWCFETEEWISARQVNPDPFLKVTDIYFFDPDEPEVNLDVSLTFDYKNEDYELAMINADKRLIEEMKDLVALGRKIDAIKLYREREKANLAEAFYIVKRL